MQYSVNVYPIEQHKLSTINSNWFPKYITINSVLNLEAKWTNSLKALFWIGRFLGRDMIERKL